MFQPRYKTLASITLSLIAMISLVELGEREVAAQVPRKAVVDQIRGRKELWIRRRGRPTPAQVGSTLEKYYDSLLVNGNSSTYATLKFLSQASQDLNLFVQTEVHPESAIYFFPCQFKGGAHLFGWGLASQLAQGCARGIRLQSGQPQALQPGIVPIQMGQGQTLVAQAGGKVHYCSVNAPNGQGWLGISQGAPCKAVVEKCLAGNAASACQIETQGQWWRNETQLTAAVECDRDQLLSAQGTGAELKEMAEKVWQDAIAQNLKACALQVYSPYDLIVAPPSDDVVQAAGTNPYLPGTMEPGVLIRTNAYATCPEVMVLNGVAIMKSARNPQGIPVKFGNQSKVSYCENDELAPINLEAESRNLSVEVFDANMRGLPFCNELQVSGGQLGDRRMIQLTASVGTLNFEYDMKTVPDKIQILHEGRELYNSDFVSHTHQGKLTFLGESGRLEIIVTGNPDIESTEWDYKISCPA